jgi:hypothetical protein
MSTATAPAKVRAAIGERTLRKDNWRRYPIVTLVIFTSWLAYGLVRSLMGADFYVAQYHYLTPFYSPCVNVECGEAALFGAFLPEATPFFIPFAALSLPVLLLFRLSCYYYRKAYYRAYWASPPACAVREPHQSYTGERRFPLISQNLHRYVDLAGQPHLAVGLHDVVPLLPAHRGRPAQELFEASGPVLGMGTGVQAERAARSARFDHPRHAGGRGPVRGAPGARNLLRPADIQLVGIPDD